MRRKAKPAGVNGGRRGSRQHGPATATPNQPQNSSSSTAIVARFVGRRCVAVGLALAGSGPTAVFSLCRQLIAHGIAPETPLLVYRGETLALRIRSVGEGAQLTVREGNGPPRFCRWKAHPRSAVPAPVAQNAPALVPQPPEPENAPASQGAYSEAAE